MPSVKIKGDIRLCRDCKQPKHKDEFVKNHIFSDGIDTLCKVCNHRRVKEWRAKGNRKSGAEARRYGARYPEKVAARQELRRQRVAAATPRWLTPGEIALIENWRAVAAIRRFLTAKDWHADHIVPFGGKNVCGLNVPWNMQVITGRENQSKANKLLDAE